MQSSRIKRIGVSALLALGVVAGSLGAFTAPSADAGLNFPTTSKLLYTQYFPDGSAQGQALRQACENSAATYGVLYAKAQLTPRTKALVHWFPFPPKLVWYTRLDCIGYELKPYNP
jgi:hypothetical protein